MLVLTGVEDLIPTRIRCPYRPARRELLYPTHTHTHAHTHFICVCVYIYIYIYIYIYVTRLKYSGWCVMLWIGETFKIWRLRGAGQFKRMTRAFNSYA